MSEAPKFKKGDVVSTAYNGAVESLTVRRVIEHPKEYQDVMPALYHMSNGQILKEHHLWVETSMGSGL